MSIEVSVSEMIENNRFGDVISGKFDAEQDAVSTEPTKRILLPQAETPKLHKILAQAGMGSRLEMERLIIEGRITVNNEPAHVGQRIQYGDSIKINGQPIRFRIEPPAPRILAYHKTSGEIVTTDDPENRPTVFRRLPRLQHGKWQSVGRLDINTEGLLLFTNSGEVANNLMHPRFGLEREYAVRVLGALNAEEKARLLSGVQLDDGMARFGSIEDGGGENANCWYRVTISEGRNREVRRLIEALGHAVSRLIRIRYGAMALPVGLKRNTWIELEREEIDALMQRAGMKASIASDTFLNKNRGGRRPNPMDQGQEQRRGGSSQAMQRNVGLRSYAENRDRGANSNGRFTRDEFSKASNRNGVNHDANRTPDPMKTSQGYIGSDSFTRQRKAANSGNGGGRSSRGR
jgi:23S rRNA pseudouridine2605 synthase